MNVTDPIADMLTRIRNAQKAKQEVVVIPASKIKIGIAHILRNESLIRDYKCVRDNKQGLLKIALKYLPDGTGAISSIQRDSKASRRVYVGAKDIPYIRNGCGVGILTTSEGAYVR